MNDNNEFYKGKKVSKVYKFLTSPISFFYKKFKLSNNLAENEPTERDEDYYNHILGIIANSYYRDYDKDTLDFTYRVWKAMLSAKQFIMCGNTSLIELYRDADKFGFSRDDINNFAYLNISNILHSFLYFKEDFFHFVDWNKAKQNTQYINLKNKMFAKNSEYLAMNDDVLCAKLRNLIAHNQFELSGDERGIAVSFYPNGKASADRLVVPLAELKQYLEFLNDLVDVEFIKAKKKERIKNAKECYLKFKTEEIEKSSQGKEEGKYQRLKEFFALKSEVFASLENMRTKSSNAVLSELNFAFNEIMCLNPEFDYYEINKKLNEDLNKIAKTNKDYGAWVMANSKEMLLTQDVVSCAQFVLTSQMYDEREDYGANQQLTTLFGEDANSIIKNIRNSLVHGWYHISSNGEIRLCDLSEQGKQKLRNYRRENKNLRNSHTTDIVSVAEAVEINQRLMNLTEHDFKEIESLDCADLLDLCDVLYQNYLQNQNLSEIEDE